MHPGVFIGSRADTQKKRILILGESHHWSYDDWITADGESEEAAKIRRLEKAASYKTEDVIKRYLESYSAGGKKDRAYRFFDYIVRTFGIDPENSREDFWSKVYFGNYVEKLCGIRDSQAQNAIAEESCQYNRSLFSFINDNGIDLVFCFSRRVYHALPRFESIAACEATDGDDQHRLEKLIYRPAASADDGIILRKPVTFYGLRHTSQGYSYRKYRERIENIIKENGITL